MVLQQDSQLSDIGPGEKGWQSYFGPAGLFINDWKPFDDAAAMFSAQLVVLKPSHLLTSDHFIGGCAATHFADSAAQPGISQAQL